MTDVLEVAGCADVGLGQLLLLALLGLLVPAAQHVVEVVRRRVGGAVEPKNVVDLRVLDVHRGHVEGWACFALPSVEQVADGGPEPPGLLLTGEVEANLAGVSGKGEKVGPGAADGEVMVELLLEHGPALLDVEDPDEVGPLGVVLDQAGHPTAPLHPAGAPVSSIHLDHSRAQRGAFPAQVAKQTVVLLWGQQDGAHVDGPPGRRLVVVHVRVLVSR